MILSCNLKSSKIKILVLDVDGTLTDGKLYIGNSGELFKAFDIKDGAGIHDILPRSGIKTIVITARESDIVKNRCKELNIDMLFQGVRDKASKLIEICNDFGYFPNENGIYEEVAYMGDDIVDLPVMEIANIRACPFNACEQVKAVANFISDYNGGDGAVRELIEWLCNEK